MIYRWICGCCMDRWAEQTTSETLPMGIFCNWNQLKNVSIFLGRGSRICRIVCPSLLVGGDWNMFYFFIYWEWNVIIPIDFQSYFSEGLKSSTTNQIHRLSIDYPYLQTHLRPFYGRNSTEVLLTFRRGSDLGQLAFAAQSPALPGPQHSKDVAPPGPVRWRFMGDVDGFFLMDCQNGNQTW